MTHSFRLSLIYILKDNHLLYTDLGISRTVQYCFPDIASDIQNGSFSVSQIKNNYRGEEQDFGGTRTANICNLNKQVDQFLPYITNDYPLGISQNKTEQQKL